MDTFFKILYYYLLLMLILFTAYLTIVLTLSPKQDRLKRGFIPCTEQLVIGVSDCERGTVTCPLKHLWQDLTCNTGVILDGFGAWIRGKQPRPWSSYLYEPEPLLPQDDDYEGDVAADMAELEKHSQFITTKQQELENAKNRNLNLSEDVIMSAPETTLPEDVKQEFMLPEDDDKIPSGNIEDEVFTEEITTDKPLSEEKTQNEKK